MNLSQRRAELRERYPQRYHSRPKPVMPLPKVVTRHSERGAARVRQIVEDRAAGLTLKQCGERAGGISRERVRQILARELNWAQPSEAE